MTNSETVIINQSVAILIDGNNIEMSLHSLMNDKLAMINFDILIGLPGQTPKTMRDTIEKVVDLKPGRIQFAYCHYRPVHRKYMTLMTRHQGLPDFYEQKAIFAEGVEAILDGGYVRTGFEHFATPEDPTTKASALLDNFLTSFLFFIPKPIAIGSLVSFFKFFI